MDNFNGNNSNGNNNEQNQQFYQMNSTKNQTDLWRTGAYHSNIQQNKNIFACNNAVNKNRSFVPVLCCCIIAVSIIFASISLLIVSAFKKDVEISTSKDVTTEVTKVEREPYFPSVYGAEDVTGYYVTKGKRYDCEDGNVYYLPDIKVEGEYSDFVEDELESIADNCCGRTPGVMAMGFECHVYVVQDIISMYIVFWGNDSGEHLCYNINKQTGEEVTDAEILETLGISEEDYNERVIELQKKEVTKRLSAYSRGTFENPKVPDRLKDSYYEMTTDEYFLSADIYVDGLGYLHIVNMLPQMEIGRSSTNIIYT